MPASEIAAVVADDHAIVRQGVCAALATIPGISVAAEAADGNEAIALVKRLHPELLVLDLGMPGASGIEVLGEVGRWSPGTVSVVFTGSESKTMALRALEMGAKGVLLKSAPPEALIAAVSGALAGDTYVGAKLEAALAGGTPDAMLTPREMQVLQSLASGLTNAAIAEKYSISPATVNNHRASIMRKLEVHTVTELLRVALKEGLIGGAA